MTRNPVEIEAHADHHDWFADEHQQPTIAEVTDHDEPTPLGEAIGDWIDSLNADAAEKFRQAVEATTDHFENNTEGTQS